VGKEDALKAHTEWTPEEMWDQEQVNFSAHLVLMFRYLEKQGLGLEDFISFVGGSVLPSWKRRGDTISSVMNGILYNVLANGGAVLNVTIGEDRAEATVTSLLRLDVMDRYGIPADKASRFWDKFVPIAAALGMQFSWERTAVGQE
jgi:hypothetical protein